jgi:hypothetical protein
LIKISKKKLKHFRDEIKYIKKTAILRAINLSLYYISSKIIVFLTLLSYVLTQGNYLTAEKVARATTTIYYVTMTTNNMCVCRCL